METHCQKKQRAMWNNDESEAALVYLLHEVFMHDAVLEAFLSLNYEGISSVEDFIYVK